MSNLSAFPYIQERAQAVPALWNDVYSILSANIEALNSDLTFSLPSGETFSLFTNLDASGGVHAAIMGIGPTPSAITTGTLSIATSSAVGDYIHFEDSSGAKSDYLLGSRVGGTSDGLNLWDLSGSTMIVSFSKQSVRFYQNVVGPVFDVGGALADTYNAATFGTGADSKESRIQAAISQASVDGVARVYIPANMYPYSAGSISFHTDVQMVREGGNWGVYDAYAYGAVGDGSANDLQELQSCLSHAAANRGVAYISAGSYRLPGSLLLDNNLTLVMERNARILRDFSAGAQVNSTMRNRDIALVGNSNIAIVGGEIRNVNNASGKHLSLVSVRNVLLDNIWFSGVSLDWNTSLMVYDATIRNLKMSSATTGGEDGLHITGGNKIVIEGCNIEAGDDGIALNSDDPLAGMIGDGVDDIHDVTISNCIISSVSAAMLRLSVNSGITRQIYNINVNGLTGFGRALNFVNLNVSPTSQIRDIRISNVLSEGRAGVASQVSNCEDITFTNVNLLSPGNRGFEVFGVRDSSFIGCSSISNRAAATAGWKIEGTTDTKFIGCSAISATQHGLAVGSASPCSRLQFIGCSAHSCTDTGLQFDNAQQCTVSNFVGRNNNFAVGETSSCTGNIWAGIQAQGNAGGVGSILGSGTVIGVAGQGTVASHGTLTGSQVSLNGLLTLAKSGENITMLGGTAHRVNWGGVGAAAPTVGSYSAGVKSVFFDSIDGGSNVGYTQGIEGGTMYFTVTNGTVGNKFKFYFGTLGMGELTSPGHWRILGSSFVTLGSATTPSYGWSSESSLGFYRSGVSTIGLTFGALAFPSASLATPSIGFSSETSLGFYRSATSTVALSYGTFRAPELWVTSSGISIGNATAGGSLIPAISSTSSKVAAFIVQGSASSFTVVTWAAVQPGDQILTTIQPDAAVSSLSSGLVMHSHATTVGQFEFRLSNVSTLVQNQSSKTYYFVRISPF